MADIKKPRYGGQRGLSYRMVAWSSAVKLAQLLLNPCHTVRVFASVTGVIIVDCNVILQWAKAESFVRHILQAPRHSPDSVQSNAVKLLPSRAGQVYNPALY